MPTGVAATMGREGFRCLGSLGSGLEMDVWWNDPAAVQIIAVQLARAVLLKGSKPYYLVSMAEEGETWARDVTALHDYFEDHFRDFHVTFSFFRDVPAFLAERQARSRRPSPQGAMSPDQASSALHTAERALHGLQRLRGLDAGDSQLLASHLATLEARRKEDVERLRSLKEAAEDHAQLIAHLQRQYRDSGSAACLLFSISSNLQLVEGESGGQEAIRSIVKELTDIHRHQVTQVMGGRLRIRVQESRSPGLAWIEQWFGGMLNPVQLERLRGKHAGAVETLTAHVAVTPDSDITAEGTLVDHRKLLAPRVVSSLLRRLDHTEALERRGAVESEGTSLRVGLLVEGERVTQRPCDLPLERLDHVYVSGKTRSGKSVAVRVLCEELAAHEVGVLVLDPRNQSAGILAPQDRPDLLGQFGRFGLGEPRGFPFAYHSPALGGAAALPLDLGGLVQGRHVVSLKSLSDAERCRWFHEILDAVFERCSRTESGSVRVVVLVEEAQLFTKRLVDEEGKADAERAEASLDRLLREGRKYGICAVVSSQSIKDFARDSAAIRQNASTKVFFANSDREIEYVRDYLDDPRALVRLRPGEAFLCNPSWGVIRAAFRPPLSKVWDLSDTETLALLDPGEVEARTISPNASRLLSAVRDHFGRTGGGLNVSAAGRAIEVTSKRRLQGLVRELDRAGLVRTRQLQERGQPRIIEPVPARETPGDSHADESDTNGRKE